MAYHHPIDIVVADKSPIVQSGLRALFDGDSRFNIVAVASDGERLLEAVDRLSFDIGVIGWEMPYLDGPGVLKALRHKEDAPKIVIYTGSINRRAPRDAMTLGAAAFCHKGDPPERLIEAVLAVADGRMVFPFLDLSGRDQDPCAELTNRERQLLVALAQGRTNAQLAEDFGISLNTVKFHLKNLYDKLGTANRAQAVALYLRDCA